MLSLADSLESTCCLGPKRYVQGTLEASALSCSVYSVLLPNHSMADLSNTCHSFSFHGLALRSSANKFAHEPMQPQVPNHVHFDCRDTRAQPWASPPLLHSTCVTDSWLNSDRSLKESEEMCGNKFERCAIPALLLSPYIEVPRCFFLFHSHPHRDLVSDQQAK